LKPVCADPSPPHVSLALHQRGLVTALTGLVGLDTRTNKHNNNSKRGAKAKGQTNRK
jgi:hypothetical protein